MHQAGLYFPYMHIRDDDWLKVAALYWPGIYRLVPDDFTPRDSWTAQEFAEAGILRSQNPGYLMDGLATDLIRTVQQNSSALLANYSIERALVEFRGRRWSDATGHSIRRPELAWIHITKFWPELVEHLLTVGLAEWVQPVDDGLDAWLGLHPALGGAYLTALSQQIGEYQGLQPLTDQSDVRLASPSRDVDSAIRLLIGADGRPGAAASAEPDAPTDEYVMQALQCVRPGDLAAVSARQIIECRQNLAEELGAFRTYVRSQQAELAAIAALPRGQRRLDAYADQVHYTIEVPLRSLERGLRLHRLAPVRTLLLTETFAAPAAGSAALAGLSITSPGVAASTGALAAIGRAWWEVRTFRSTLRRESPVAYLLDVRDRLSSQTLIGRARRVLGGGG